MGGVVGPKGLILSQAGILVLGMLLCMILTPVCRRAALRFGVLDHPGTRKVHKEPKPLLGGLAIFLSFDIVLFVLWLFGYIEPGHSLQVLSIAAGGLVIMTVGLIDDIRPIKARVKLLMQIAVSVVAAVIIIWGDVRLSIYDVSGKLIRTLVHREMEPGQKTVSWDGNDIDGHESASGVYFYVLETATFKQSRKMILLR